MAKNVHRSSEAGNAQLAVEVHKKAGRAILPPNKVFRDKKKYTRKQKHKRGDYQDGSGNHSFFIY